MKNKLIKTALPFIAAAALAAFLSSCSGSKGETRPEPAETEAQTEQTTAAETTTAAAKKTKKTSAAKTTEKKSAETTAKTTKAAKTTKKTKKTTTTTFTVTAVDVPPIDENNPRELESFFDKESGFFSENVLSFLGEEKKNAMKGLTYNEDYMVMNGSDKDEEQTLSYVVDGEKRYFFTLEFKNGILVRFDCGSQMDDFNPALNMVKSKGWIRDESKVEKGKRVYKVPGRKVAYSIFKIRDKDGTSFITQSYELIG